MIQFIGRHTANKLFLSGSSAVLPSFICIHEHPGGICELQIGLRQVVLLETASRVQCYITPSTTELSSELFNFTDSNWRLYTFTWTYISNNIWSAGENRTYDLRFYENGVLNGDVDRMEIQLVSSGGFQIGGDYSYPNVYDTIEGYYDNFQIYNKALSQAEITYLYSF